MSSNIDNNNNVRAKSKRGWSTEEERLSIIALREIIDGGFRSGNGLKNGYYQALLAAVKKRKPWKKEYYLIMEILSRPETGWNSATRMIEAPDELWDELASTKGLKGLRNKVWPFYEDWVETFGSDRASGRNEVAHEEAAQNEPNDPEDIDFFFSDPQHIVPDSPIVQVPTFVPNSKAESSAFNNTAPNSVGSHKKKGTKRQREEVIGELVGELRELRRSSDTVADIMQQKLGNTHEAQLAQQRESVSILRSPAFCLTPIQVVDVSKELMNTPGNIQLFLCLSDDERKAMVKRIVQGLS